MLDIKQRIDAAKVGLEKAKNAQLVAKTNKQNSGQQMEEIAGKMAEAGVTPENIQQEIAKLEVQLEQDIQQVEQLMPRVE